MTHEIKTINLGGVNCYLVKAGDGFVLIDTGLATRRDVLDRELAGAGCKPGNLRLVLLTHGDVDHADNGAYLRTQYGAPIAMQGDDAGMVERGDMSWNRKAKPDRVTLMGAVILRLSRLTLFFGKHGTFETFKPDCYVADGQDLSGYGLDAQVLYLPGHSKGSIGILTTRGDLFCGDLFANFGRPGMHFMLDDLAAANASRARLARLKIETVYPGHGKPFPWNAVGAKDKA